MTAPLQAILESKRKLRRELESRPIAEKLRMLDAMREREVDIRKSTHIEQIGRSSSLRSE